MDRKTFESEFLFNKVAGLQLYQKETLVQVFSCEYCGIFTNTYFETKETPAQVFSCEYYESFKNTYIEKHLRTVSEFFCNEVYL